LGWLPWISFQNLFATLDPPGVLMFVYKSFVLELASISYLITSVDFSFALDICSRNSCVVLSGVFNCYFMRLNLLN
jgi:hypothetical protein